MEEEVEAQDGFMDKLEDDAMEKLDDLEVKVVKAIKAKKDWYDPATLAIVTTLFAGLRVVIDKLDGKKG